MGASCGNRIPTAYGRSGDLLYIHGSAASRMLRSLAQGVAVCVTVMADPCSPEAAAIIHEYRSVVMSGDRERALFQRRALPGEKRHCVVSPVPDGAVKLKARSYCRSRNPGNDRFRCK